MRRRFRGEPLLLTDCRQRDALNPVGAAGVERSFGDEVVVVGTDLFDPKTCGFDRVQIAAAWDRPRDTGGPELDVAPVRSFSARPLTMSASASLPPGRRRRAASTKTRCFTGERLTAVASFAGVGYHLDLAKLTPGDRVLDLGSGSGTDAFCAALQVGETGRVIGVDFTDEQMGKAIRVRDRDGFAHVEFVEASIDSLPFRDAAFDVIISNGVARSRK